MKKKIIITLIVIIYSLSFIQNYYYFKKAYSKGGQWENIDPDLGAYMFTFVPVFNTGSACWQLSENIELPNFFNVKK